MRKWYKFNSLIFVMLIIVYGVSCMALIGHIIDQPYLYQWGETVGMAPNTAIAFIAITTAELCHIMEHHGC